MELDSFVHGRIMAWYRLDQVARRRRLSGLESDELVALYQRASADLVHLQAVAPDQGVVGPLTDLVARARARAMGARSELWPEIVLFFTHRFPAAVYGAWRWAAAVAAVFFVTATVVGVWVANDAAARSTLGSPAKITRVTEPGGEFETYYSEYPASSFAAKVWTNNAWVAAIALFLGFLIVPAVYVLVMNALNVGVTGGLMAHADRLDAYFGFLAPHGILELTAIFVAGGAGLKLGWTLIDPGRLSRVQALAKQGQTTGAVALGLVVVLLFSGAIEAFVTPSSMPTALKILIGLAAEGVFLTYIGVLGRRAADEGFSGAHRSLDDRWQVSIT